VTQEFHISVTPVGHEEYLVRTERVAPGVPLAEEQVTWAVEDWLAQARQLMNDPLLGVLQGDRVNRIGGYESRNLATADTDSTLPSLSLAEIGQQLYGALFQGTLRDSWMTAQAIAQHRGEVLRLRLGLKGSRLPRLPWEVLHETDSPAERLRQRDGLSLPPRPIATGTGVVFSRYQPGTSLTLPGSPFSYEADQPLRILMVIAAPTDQKRLELKREATHLQQELRHQTGSLPESVVGTLPDMQLTILDQPGREQLTQALEQGKYQVLHYAGHSNLGASGGNLYLVNNKTGLTEILTGDDLAGLLVNNGIRMAVFNSCRGAYTAAADPSSDMGERNLAEALVGRGIPAVLAMAERIPDDVALTLSRLFYRNLKQGYPIDLSLSRARQGLISAYGSHQLYWALPILYLHSEFDGYLTEGDRTLDNPADRLMLIPQGYDISSSSANSTPPLPTDAIPDSRYIAPTDDWAALNEAVLLGDDLGDLTEDTGNSAYPNYETNYEANYESDYESQLDEDLDSEADLDYEEEVSLVGELIQQLSAKTGQNFAREARSEARSEEVPLMDAPDSALDIDLDDLGTDDLGTDDLGTGSLDNDELDNNDLDNGDLDTDEVNEEAEFYSNQDAFQKALLRMNSRSEAEETQWLDDNFPAKLSRTDSAAYALDAEAEPTQPRSGGLATAIQPAIAQPTPSRRKAQQLPRFVVPLLGAVGIGAIALISFLVVSRTLFNSGNSPAKLLPPEIGSEIPELPAASETNLDAADTTNVTAIAIEHFNQGQISEGAQATKVLLDRNALPQAIAALATIPPDELEQPEISFLRGRVAWQSIQQEENDEETFSFDDVRRYWETAVREQPSSPDYKIALGFAHYAENRSNEAIQTWVDALSQLEQQAAANQTQPASQSASADLPLPDQLLQGKQALTAYAGIALALLQASTDQPRAAQSNLESKAAKLYQMVMMSDPTNFQTEALSTNWLWTPEAIQAWDALSKLEQ
jgi:hypothetical protein